MNTLKKGSKGEEVKTLQRLLYLLEDGVFGEVTEEAVKEFQKSQNLVSDGIVGQKTWDKLLGGLKKTTRSIKEIIIHCSATPEGREVTISEIKKWHKARGFSDIGYHYVIYLDGSIHVGRDINTIGAHTTGHNTGSIGICYVGGLSSGKASTPKDTRTPAQKKALENLLRKLKVLYPKAVISGHSEWANKACPCFDARSEYKNL